MTNAILDCRLTTLTVPFVSLRRFVAKAIKMPHCDSEQELHDALENFETAIHTPLVSGELRAWSQRLSQSWAELASVLQPHMNVHRRIIKQIAMEDTDLLPKVTQLTADDKEIMRTLRMLERKINQLSAAGTEIEPKETKLHGDVESVVELGTNFITHVRKQEIALGTWLTEAFNRDRGTGD